MNRSERSPLPPIIVVDDEPEALCVIQSLFRRAGIPNPITTFASGVALIAHLETAQESGTHGLEDACMLLLDLRMPELSGIEVLDWLRRHPFLEQAIVVMLSVSDHPAEITQARELGAHTYLLKYPAPETLAALVHLAEEKQHASRRH